MREFQYPGQFAMTLHGIGALGLDAHPACVDALLDDAPEPGAFNPQVCGSVHVCLSWRCLP